MTMRLRRIIFVGLLVLSACGGGGGGHGATESESKSNQSPVSSITVSQLSSDQLTTFKFSSSGSKDADGRIVKYNWNFGDGSASNDQSPIHTYKASGTYSATLTVTDDQGATASKSSQVTITNPAVSAVVTDGALSISLPGIATVSIPQSTFDQPTNVGVWTTASKETAEDFDVTAQLFRDPIRAQNELRVNTSSFQPKLAVSIVASLPVELKSRFDDKDEPQVFVQILQNQSQGIIDTFEVIDFTYDETAGTLQFELDPLMFTNQRTSDRTWEAVLVVGATGTKPVSSTKAEVTTMRGKLVAAEAEMPWPSAAYPEFILQSRSLQADILSATSAATANPDDVCRGSTLQPPLAELTVTSKFNPPAHYGVDYRAPNGTQVFSMANGTVVATGYNARPLNTPNPRSGKMIRGWGWYVMVDHEDGSRSVYGHLQEGDVKVSKGQKVTAGQVLALSDDSGGSKAPHLHVEYVPNNELYQKGKKGLKADASLCIGTNVSGSVVVEDNGNIADDAFSVQINQKTVCTTTIGQKNTCAVGALRTGTATLTITATIAPDNVGTYQITLNGGITFQDGSLIASGTIAQNASASFPIVIK